MHWIESLLNLSPDGGSGSLELFIAVAVLAVVAAAALLVVNLAPAFRR